MPATSSWPRAMANANTVLVTPSWNKSGAGLRGIIGFHSHGPNGEQFLAGTGMGAHAIALAEAGFAVMGVSTPFSGNSWLAGTGSDAANVSAMGAYKKAYDELKNVVGISGTKIGLLAWSMGGGEALIFAKQNPTLVACAWLFSPITDLDWAHATAGYTPAYPTGGVSPNAGWAAEIDTAYGGNYAVNAVGHKIRDEYATWSGLGIKIMVDQASDDTVVPPAAASAFVTGVNDPNVILYAPAATGDHPGAVVNRNKKEVMDFFQSNLLGAA